MMKRLFLLALLFFGQGCVPIGSTKPIVKIGLVAPFEGPDRPLGYNVLYAVKLAIWERNERGGVAGYMVELVALDDGNEPSAAAQQARKMILDPDVMGVVGHFSNATTLAAIPEYHQAGLTLISPATTADDITERGYREIFRLCARNEQLGAEAAHFAVTELGAKRLGLIGDQDDLAEAFVVAAQRLGAAVVVDEAIDAPDLLMTIEMEKPDLVFFSGGAVAGALRPAQGGAEVMIRARERGIKAPFMGGSEWDSPKLVQIGGEAVEGGIYLAVAPRIEEARGAQGFIDRYMALAQQRPGPQALLAYDATNLLLDALARAIVAQGAPKREAVLAEMAKTDHLGITGPITFDAKGDRLDPQVYIYEISE